jgi:NitT/TauT family transport system substrate-binding protein/putative hydroxymethylpyrimidine transport system substrate-binding protein
MNPDVPRFAAAAAVLVLALGGCGSDDDPDVAAAPPSNVELALDFTPNPVQAPVFTAARERLDRKHGIRLTIRPPGRGPDGLKLVATGKVDLALLDIHDLAIAQAKGTDIVGVGALVAKPLAALVAQPGIHRPRDLEGRTVGVSGLPSDPAFLRAIVEHDGGDATKVRQITIGFAGVQAILSRKIDAVPAFWNAEGVALRERGRAVRAFKVEEYGAPAFPEVVVVTSRATLEHRRDDIRAAVAAIADGVTATRAHPGAAVKEIAAAAGDADTSLIRAQFDAVAPLWSDDLHLDRRVLDAWADWDAKVGMVQQRPDVDKLFAFDR